MPPIRSASEQDDTEYLEYFRSKGGTEDMVRKARRLRELVPSFLESCVEEVLAATPRVVGFSSTFCQNVSSLVFAKLLKSRDSSLKIIFGGSNCDGPMGAALHKAFPWVDIVVRGEGERVVSQLVGELLAGRDVQPHPGICYRQGEEHVVVELRAGELVPMDEVPMPNYDEYFERLQENACRAEIAPKVTIGFESARGCWWGAKKHCTFCGLNGSTMTFRSKRPEIVVQELATLARRHGRLDFHAVDNIIDMRYFREMLPRLRDAPYDFRLFYETKANLKKEHLGAMRDAGVLAIQPGIESLSTPILKLMEKGITALQNIRLLKWCSEFGITPNWNLIYGFPREEPEEYARMAELIRLLTHLIPPQSLTPLHLERFSPYHQRPDSYGLKITGPKPTVYSHLIHQADEAMLNDLAYSFDYSYVDGLDPETYVAQFKQSVEGWRKDYLEGSNLTYRRGPGFLQINDRRPGLGGYDYSLAETEAKIYLTGDEGSTSIAIWKSLLADGCTEIELDEVEDFLQEMTDLKLMYEEGGCYLSLAVAANPETQRAAGQVQAGV